MIRYKKDSKTGDAITVTAEDNYDDYYSNIQYWDVNNDELDISPRRSSDFVEIRKLEYNILKLRQNGKSQIKKKKITKNC